MVFETDSAWFAITNNIHSDACCSHNRFCRKKTEISTVPRTASSQCLQKTAVAVLWCGTDDNGSSKQKPIFRQKLPSGGQLRDPQTSKPIPKSSQSRVVIPERAGGCVSFSKCPCVQSYTLITDAPEFFRTRILSALVFVPDLVAHVFAAPEWEG